RRRQSLRVRTPAGFQEEVRGSLQAAPRCRGEVLRIARQPRRARAALLQAVQHGRKALLLLQAGQTECAVLRAREYLPRSRTDRVVRERTEGFKFRLEDS